MYGKYRHTVDPKGRLFVPSKLRDELGEAFYVTLGLDHCLSVYTEAGWQSTLDKYNALPISQARKMRFLFASRTSRDASSFRRSFASMPVFGRRSRSSARAVMRRSGTAKRMTSWRWRP